MGIKEIEISGKNLKIHEPDEKYNSMTGKTLTGSWVWDSAPILSQWMSTQGILQFDFTGKTVIELGAGTGLPGLTAAILGAGRVILTDVESLIPALIKNVEVNGLQDRVEVRRLVWGTSDYEEEIMASLSLSLVDLVVMSDVFFDGEEVSELVKTLKRIREGNENVRIWAGTEIREWTWECIRVLEDGGFRIVELFVCKEGQGFEEFAVYNLVPTLSN